MAWSEFATVTVEIASISGLTEGGLNAGYWQPDAHETLWQPDYAEPDALGYGEWTEDVTYDPHKDWGTLPWFEVHCDTSEIHTQTGLSPYEWNASPGSLSVILWDAHIDYTPIGPIGILDDIGIDTPIRIRATGPQFPWFYDSPSNRNETILWAGLIRQILHRVSIGGAHITTISATEMIELYGRTNPVALTSPRPVEHIKARAMAIHDRCDRPLTFPYPSVATTNQSNLHAPDDLHDNLWQEMTHAFNCDGAITAQSLYPRLLTPDPEGNAYPGSPMCDGLDPVWAIEFPNPIVTRTQVRPYCSMPNPRYGYPEASALAIAPTELAITHNKDGVANDISLAIAGGGEGTAESFQDQASIDRWGRHTYTRHDLKLNPGQPLAGLGGRMLLRSKDAVYLIDSLTFPVACPRDLGALVGWATYGNMNPSQWSRYNGQVCAPGEVWLLVWESPQITAYLFITSVSHSITRDTWTATVSAELQAVNQVPGSIPVPVPAALASLEPV